MEDLKLITNDLKEFLKSNGYNLYHLSLKTIDNEKTLQIEIDNHLDLNGIAEVSRIVSDYLDSKDYIEDKYMLDVSTVGLERVLYSKDDIKDALSKYVFIKFNKSIDNLKDINGYLVSFANDNLVIKYLNKNIEKEINVAYENIKYIRLAIDFKGVRK